MLDVTVCILSYNRLGYLCELLDSIFKQTKQPKRIVIYDNASDEIVFQGLADYFSRGVEWVGASENHPFIWNFNRAMQSSDSEYTILLHDDDRLCENYLETQLDLLTKNPECIAVSCNGYFIDETGNRIDQVNYRNVGTLTKNEGGFFIESFSRSGQVALKYASNSCIPFSPTIYRTSVAKSIKFRDEFSKVCDAVYFCDLADVGLIFYQTEPLYECRVHSGQDSQNFPYHLMNQLEGFYLSRVCESDAEKARLNSLLIRQHTIRNIRQICHGIAKGKILSIGSLLNDPRFSFSEAFKTMISLVFHFIWQK